MKLWTTVLAFNWDTGNLHKNKLKHNVTNQETEEIFSNEPLIVSADIRHTTKMEERYHALGKTNNNRKLFLSFTIRTNKISVISIRDMNKKEKAIYEHD